MHLKTIGPVANPVKLLPKEVAAIAKNTNNGDALESEMGDKLVLMSWLALSWHRVSVNVVEIYISVLTSKASNVPSGIDLIGLRRAPDELDPAKIPPNAGKIIENVEKKSILLCRLIQLSWNLELVHSINMLAFEVWGNKIPKK